MKARARPRPAKAQNVDHQFEITNGRVASRHGGAADRLDGADAGVVRGLRDIARTRLTGVLRAGRHQVRKQFGKDPEEIEVVAQQAKALGRNRTRC